MLLFQHAKVPVSLCENYCFTRRNRHIHILTAKFRKLKSNDYKS